MRPHESLRASRESRGRCVTVFVPHRREDLRRCLLQAGVKDTPTSFVFTDAQVVMESFLEDVNNILNAGDVPNLYGALAAS